jgi:hypothetical protein
MDQIQEAIYRSDVVILVLSPDSIKSPWVLTEICHACERELRENTRVLFPILIDSFELIENWKHPAPDGRDLAYEIRKYFILNFSKWGDPDCYKKAFENLLRSLAQWKGPA